MVQVSLKLKVEWFPDWLKATRLGIIGEKTKERLKEQNLVLLRNPNNEKSVIVRVVSINNAIFSEIEEMTDFARVLDSNEYILVSRALKNVLDVTKDDLILLESPEMNLFTYGTFLSAFWDFTNSEYPFLRLPGSRHYVLEEFHFLRAKLDDFIRIWPPGLSFPFIMPQEGEDVIGELYFDLPPSKFIELDRIEGEGYLYHKENVSVELLDTPFRGLKVNAVTYVGGANLISEHPKEPTFDRLTFGDVIYIEHTDADIWQKVVAEEELFLKRIEGTIPMLITTYSPTLEKQYQSKLFDNVFETSLDELNRLANELMREFFLQSDEKQLPYLLIETLLNMWSPKILDTFNKNERTIKRYVETACNSFIERMQSVIEECLERFDKCLILILQEHSQEGTELIVEYNNEILDIDSLTKNLKSNFQLTYSTDKDKIIEDLRIQSNIEKIAIVQLKIHEEILLNIFKRENLAVELAKILHMIHLT
ncbi:gamma-glutamylcyclotransferase family protein [Candidatus Borrarchaeum sp.]|uniref:gamma-glutamylcyclotransferase family protein n=1 Tax=Candidatus Borrarchaeum sp. TaxID=2846742 RepID=UPI002579F9F9|nr:gamma-glutamylcyclotransferase family protein [Candidatus Borrarchaeum sp.]